MGEVLLKGFECERCGHRWVPREESGSPIVCPKCKSPYWNKPRKNIVTPEAAALMKKYRTKEKK